MLCLLHGVTGENNVRNFSAMNSGYFRKSMTKLVGSYIVLSQIDTLRCQRKELEYKGDKDACYAAAAVGKKVPLEIKRR